MTLAQVAKKAGVSITTASRVFNDNPSVRDYLRDRVLAAADEMGYRPNALARGLRTRYANLVSLGVQQIENPFFGGLVSCLSRRLLAANYGAILCNNIDRVNEINQTARAAGTILVSPSPAHIREVVQERALVTIDAPSPELSLASNVAIDFSGPYRAAIDTLVARGADRIAFLCPEEEWTVNLHNKFRFARQQMAARGCTDGSPASGYFSTAAAVVEELREGMPLAAVLCANDLVANDLLCALWPVGIQPGRDMVVVGCDGTVPRPGMWTIPVDLDEVAAAAVELLLAGMNEAQDLREVTVCPPLQTA